MGCHRRAEPPSSPLPRAQDGDDDLLCCVHHQRLGKEAAATDRQSILEKAMAVLQLTTLAQFGCGGEQAFYKNSLKNTPKGNHYGDLRAKLEVAVDHILDAF